MKTITQTVEEIGECILSETDIVNRCPLPLDVIPNRMGINLCSVESVSWSRQDDGQLTNLTINFTPSQGDLSEDRPKEVCGVPPGIKTSDYILKTVLGVFPEPGTSAMSQIKNIADEPSDKEQLNKYNEAIAYKKSILDLIPSRVPFDLGFEKLFSLMDQDNITISYVLLDGTATQTTILSKDVFRGNKIKLFHKLMNMENAYVYVVVKENGEHKELVTYEIDANDPHMFKIKLGLCFPKGVWLPEEEAI